MRCFLLFACLLAAAVAPIRSGPVREKTDEDRYFRSLSSAEQKDVIREALEKIRDEEQLSNEQDSDSPSKPDKEIVLPEEVAKLLDASKHDNEEGEEFVGELAEWIADQWHLTPEQAAELVRTGRTCPPRGCLHIRRISNFCCPFGK